MRLILINPRFPESFWSFNWAIRNILPGRRAMNPPLGLATLAALCPSDWQVEIVDENIETVPLTPIADVIGICGMAPQFRRQRELLTYYRGRGYYVVAGGSYASLCHADYMPLADTVVAGEAEYIWKTFCHDFENLMPKPLYRETGTVALIDSPVPRFDLLKLDRYVSVTLQYSRGCPFRCEFCDIIVMFGRKPRVKSLEQVEHELDALRALGVRRAFFVDDNLIGNRPQSRALLKFLTRYQKKHNYNFFFGTQVSLNVAQDAELLGLFRGANFGWVFIGIETPDSESLKETRKTQNLREDPLVSVRRIYSHGIDVLAGFIIGFDNDTLVTFDRQYRFITGAGIQSAMVGLLTALPQTPLYERMQREGRLRQLGKTADNTRAMSNIAFKTMCDDAVAKAYRALYRRLLTDSGIGERIGNKMTYLHEPVYQSGYAPAQRMVIFLRLLWKGIFPGGAGRTVRFMHSLMTVSPAKVPLVIGDWVVGLSMHDFARRRLAADVSVVAIERRVASLRSVVDDYLTPNKVDLTVREDAAPDLAISLDGRLDRRFFKQITPHLRRLLERTPVTLTLRIGRSQFAQVDSIRKLLMRLTRYGDQISVVAEESLRQRLAVDSSVFNLVLSGSLADQDI